MSVHERTLQNFRYAEKLLFVTYTCDAGPNYPRRLTTQEIEAIKTTQSILKETADWLEKLMIK
jgi:hypothetical protein